MELQAATQLIEQGVLKNRIQTWADLGAGKGLFTCALSQLLLAGSSITAIDKDQSALSKVSVDSKVSLHTNVLDLASENLELRNLDGILMANSLHYIKDQKAFLNSLRLNLKPTGRLIIVEYNMDRSNAWVPYPISFNTLEALGFRDMKKIGEQSSSYNKEGIYSAVILF
jgi:ubiquinone/menaquinone biosynthesis C-methylase UbiE